FMLNTGLGSNLIKEARISGTPNLDPTHILKLNGINNSPVYTTEKITKIILGIPVDFHIISDDFPIQSCGILGNDFFQQTKDKIDY
ncbi:hypothetical protein EAI_11212, partial [Harpegnathos saltator]